MEMEIWYKGGIFFTEAKIQLLLKRFSDSSVSSLIQVGWCEEGHSATKNLLQHSHGWTIALNYYLLEVGCLPYAVMKQPPIPSINLGRTLIDLMI